MSAPQKSIAVHLRETRFYNKVGEINIRYTRQSPKRLVCCLRCRRLAVSLIPVIQVEALAQLIVRPPSFIESRLLNSGD